VSGDTLGAVPRPRTGETPQHNIRVPADLWSAAVAKARAEGRTLSKVIVEFLRGYVYSADAERDGDG
jgi:hypothetical protein